jgi:hypothetical protein
LLAAVSPYELAARLANLLLWRAAPSYVVSSIPIRSTSPTLMSSLRRS